MRSFNFMELISLREFGVIYNFIESMADNSLITVFVLQYRHLLLAAAMLSWLTIMLLDAI